MTKLSWLDRARAAFKARDEDEFEKVAKEKESKDEAPAETEEEKKKREAKEAEDTKTSDALSKVADALADLSERVGKLETKDAGESEAEAKAKKKKDEDDAEAEAESAADKKTKDAALREEASDVYARAEILSPGMRLPTFDAAGDSKKAQDSLCSLRRAALTAAYENPKTRDAVAPLVAGKDLSKLTCDALSSTFIGASEIVRRSNNAQTLPTFDGSKSAATVRQSISEINRRNSEFWKRS